jgi:integrase
MAKKGEITTTEPLRTKEQIDNMMNAIPAGRDRMLFLIGINSALRVSDLVKLRVSDFDFSEGRIIVREQKTGKAKNHLLHPLVAEKLHQFILNRGLKDYIFCSQKGGHISTQRVRYIITKAAEVCGYKHISTHTMRKTFGYQAWKAKQPFPLIMAAFNHVDPKVTKRYLGIQQDDLDGMTSSLHFGI